MGVIAPLSEQLTKPLPNAMVLVNLKELSGGAYKLLPEGWAKNFLQKLTVKKRKTSFSVFPSLWMISGTRLVVSVRGDEPYEELEILKNIDATMILHDVPFDEDKVSRVHAARR